MPSRTLLTEKLVIFITHSTDQNPHTCSEITAPLGAVSPIMQRKDVHNSVHVGTAGIVWYCPDKTPYWETANDDHGKVLGELAECLNSRNIKFAREIADDIDVGKHWEGHELIVSKNEIGKTAFGVGDGG